MLWTGNEYFAPSYISKSDRFLDPYGSIVLACVR